MDVCVCVCVRERERERERERFSVGVRGCIAKQGILSSASLAFVRVSRVIICLLWRENHTQKQKQTKPARPEEKDEDSQLGGKTLKQLVQSWEADSPQVKGQTFQKLEVRLRSGELGVRLRTMESR